MQGEAVRVMCYFFLLSLPLLWTHAETTEAGKEKVRYKYKAEEAFDFEALSVKGELISPGDLASKVGRKKRFDPSRYQRKNFDQFIKDDLFEVY